MTDDERIYPDELDLQVACATEGVYGCEPCPESLEKAASYLATASALLSDSGPEPDDQIRLAIAMAIEGIQTIFKPKE